MKVSNIVIWFESKVLYSIWKVILGLIFVDVEIIVKPLNENLINGNPKLERLDNDAPFENGY